MYEKVTKKVPWYLRLFYKPECLCKRVVYKAECSCGWRDIILNDPPREAQCPECKEQRSAIRDEATVE